MLTIRCRVRWKWKFSRSSGSRMPEGTGEEQTAVVAGKCRQRCKCFVPTNTAKPRVPSSCWLSTRMLCSTPDMFVHRQRVVIWKETLLLPTKKIYIYIYIYRFINLFDLVFHVDFLSKRTETLNISKMYH